MDIENLTFFFKQKLENGAKLLVRDHKKMTSLAQATLHGFLDVMVCLFSYGEYKISRICNKMFLP
jgi:hypothetical protein